LALNMAISVFGLLTDVAILLLPVPVVLRLQTDVRRRGEKSLLLFPFTHSKTPLSPASLLPSPSPFPPPYR
jgi:hypothetical protein